MTEDTSVQVSQTQTEDQQTVPETAPVSTPESVEQDKQESDDQVK